MPAHAEPHDSRQGRRPKALGEGTRGKQGTRTAQRYEDFARAIGAQAGSSWHLEHEKIRRGSVAGTVDQRRYLHAAASQSPERAQ